MGTENKSRAKFSINGLFMSEEDFLRQVNEIGYPLVRNKNYWQLGKQNGVFFAMGHDPESVYVISSPDKDDINRILKPVDEKNPEPENTHILKPESIYENRILELAKKLDELKIPYRIRELHSGKDCLKFDWCDADIVCHYFSYGGDDGLFEIMGDKLMTKIERSIDSVVGNITLEDAVSRIKNAWESRESKKKEMEN